MSESTRSPLSWWKREKVLERDGYTCQKCGEAVEVLKSNGWEGEEEIKEE